ncbi:hypothetical protein [Neobacillus sp. LXY-4]|uniref:hypothetical protein n=1 Tax=Neobacillus sp. LXY-4 TaxID=3379826 RepID=UPI003EDFCE02
MSQFPPFHPEWLVTFWFSTPVLRLINPHWFLIILAVSAMVVFFIKRQKSVEHPQIDSDEEKFQHLLTKKQIIEKKIAELEMQKQQGELSEEKYELKRSEYKKHLDKVILDLHYYT